MNRPLQYPAALAFCLAAAPASAEWGAVAINNAIVAYGYSNSYSTRGDAERRALAQCNQSSKGASGCVLILATRNCAGLSRADGPFFVAEARTKSAASKAATAQCQSANGTTCRSFEFCASS